MQGCIEERHDARCALDDMGRVYALVSEEAVATVLISLVLPSGPFITRRLVLIATPLPRRDSLRYFRGEMGTCMPGVDSKGVECVSDAK